MHLQSGTLLQGGKYRIERVLGQGGFGITYLATHTALGTRMAIKEFFLIDANSRGANGKLVTVSLEANRYNFESQRNKFLKEAQRLQVLGSEHIVKVYDFFDENNTSYYVMEYIEGCSLEQWMKQRGGKLTEHEVQDILRQVLDALMVMHGQHLWHLDIKPNNIMRQSNGNIKLIDFGASKLIDPNDTTMMTSTAVACTPGFAPMEQMSRDFSSFGPWTDFYALGATLYLLLTGNCPPTVNQILSYGTSSFQYPAAVSQNMRYLVEWMMSPNHKKRPQSVNAIRQRLISNNQPEVTISSDPRSSQVPTFNASPQWTVEKSSTPWGWIIAVFLGLGLIILATTKCSGTYDQNDVTGQDSSVGNVVDEAMALQDTVACSVDTTEFVSSHSQNNYFNFTGYVGNNSVKGHITINGNRVSGQYGYKGKSSGIRIDGEYDTRFSEEGVSFVANEYNGDFMCGHYVGQRIGNTISGSFTNYKDDEFYFEWYLQ